MGERETYRPQAKVNIDIREYHKRWNITRTINMDQQGNEYKAKKNMNILSNRARDGPRKQTKHTTELLSPPHLRKQRKTSEAGDQDDNFINDNETNKPDEGPRRAGIEDIKRRQDDPETEGGNKKT